MDEMEQEAIADAIAEPVAEVLSDVVERQEASAELADAIAEAALEGERGRRLDQLETGLAACLETVNNLATTLETLPMMLAQTTLDQLEPISQRLSAVEDGLSGLTAAALSQLTLPNSEAPVQETKTEAPEKAPAPADAAESPAPEPRRRRFHSI